MNRDSGETRYCTSHVKMRRIALCSPHATSALVKQPSYHVSALRASGIGGRVSGWKDGICEGGKAKTGRLKLFTTCIFVAVSHDERSCTLDRSLRVKISFFVHDGRKVNIVSQMCCSGTHQIKLFISCPLGDKNMN